MMKQRKKMCELYSLYRGDKQRCVKAYAEAERRGKVLRRSNKHDIRPEDYDSRLFDDGVRKGWLKQLI